MPILWLLFRREAVPSKKQPPPPPPPTKQHPAKQRDPSPPPPPPSSIPSWRRHPLTRLQWLRQRIRAQRWDYDHDQRRIPELVSSIDEPSVGLEPRPSLFTSPLGYFRYNRKIDCRVMARQRSMREIVALKGFEAEKLYNLRSSSPVASLSSTRSTAVDDHEDLTLSETVERAVVHIFWALGWLSDWTRYRLFELLVKCLLWKGAQWIRRIYVWWLGGTMAWTIECYAMPPAPCSALALRIGGRTEEMDQELVPVVGELERAQKVIEHALAHKGTGRDSVKCSVGDLARLSWSMFNASWRMSRIYICIAKQKLL
ncbi:hypothetical protein PG985_006369 [Apiospora marii]|uniref:Uncharacterized protein n=1 Tax=Apiospora marii TaxID=335849 RepID=A0ABR1S7F7_9PEZI